MNRDKRLMTYFSWLFQTQVSEDHDLANNYEKIHHDQIELIYEQIPLGIFAQMLVSIFLYISLLPITNYALLTGWLSLFLCCSILWFIVSMGFRYRPMLFSYRTWLNLFSLFTFLSGLGWGFSGTVLIPTDYLLHQTFVVIVILGMTAGANPFFSPIFYTYLLYLLPSFLPFDMWLFYQGGLYSLLGFCGFIYIIVMAGSSFYTHNFLITSLRLRYQNINLDALNHFLEKRVAERTAELEKSLAITRSTLESTADGIIVVDLQDIVDNYNQKFLDLWNLGNIKNQQLSLSNLIISNSQLVNADAFQAQINKIKTNKEEECYFELFFQDGRVFDCYSKPHKVREKIIGRVWNFRDITLRKELEQQLSFQANHDLLTGLPNRTLLYERIIHNIQYAKRLKTNLAIFFLDLDNFKLINDNLGHEAGDLLLKEIAHRLNSCVRESDTVARFGGDEFVILFSGESNDLSLLSQKILENITRPVQLINRELVVTTSIGASVYPRDGTDPATLLKKADMAMYQAKNHGRNNFQLFEETTEQNSGLALEMQIQMRNSLDKGEFFLVYQPIFDLKSKKILGAEALIRWQHPHRGIVSPTEFIPVAEHSGIIIPLGEWVFKEACSQYQLWQEADINPQFMAINISAIQVKRDNFIKMIKKHLRQTRINPENIELEITESSIMDNKKIIISSLEKLKDLGMKLTIDDFGTGYSSLNYLRQFPITKLKIDRSFIRDCMDDNNDASIVEAMVAIGRGLKLHILAEGIETEEQLNFLIEAGCTQGQGYVFSKPLTGDQFSELFKKINLNDALKTG